MSAPQQVLAELAATRWLADAGISTVQSTLVRSENELRAAVAKADGPLVLKVAAPGAIHKSDDGLVEVGVEPSAASAAYRRLMWRTTALDVGAMDGVLVQPLVRGVELLIGVRRDLELGPFLMIGAGGVLVELIDDVATVPASASRRQIAAAVARLRIGSMLGGLRGAPPVATEAFVALAAQVGRVARRHPQLVELDLNPVILNADGATAVDARLVLSDPGPSRRRGFRSVHRLFAPRSIAVVGASRDPNKLGA